MGFQLDTSIPSMNITAINPAGAIEKAVNMANMLDSRREQKNTIAKRDKVLAIFNNAPIDPTTGDLDHEKIYRAILPIDPDAAEHYKTNVQTALIQQATAAHNQALAAMERQKAQQNALESQQTQSDRVTAQNQLANTNQTLTDTSQFAQEAPAILNEPTMAKAAPIALDNGMGSIAAGNYQQPSEMQIAKSQGLTEAAGVLPQAKTKLDVLKSEVPKTYAPPRVPTPRVPGSGSLSIGQKQEQFDEQQWPKLMKLANPLTASSRSVVGVAGTSNMRADRAIAILKDPKAGPSEIKALVDTDILGIMKGGVPDAEQLKNGLIQTFGTDLQQKLQYLSSNPQQFNNPAVRQRLLEIVKGLKAVDNKIITDALGIAGASYAPLIGRHPDWWKAGQAAVLETGAGMENTPTAPAVSSIESQLIAKAKTGDVKAQTYLKSIGKTW
jgi:hypothetical protein